MKLKFINRFVMKSYLSLAIVIFIAFLQMSCATQHQTPTVNLTQETWQQSVVRSTASWKKGADHWFFTGEPNATEMANRHAPATDVISTMTATVSDFTAIKVDGAFQLQVFGTDEHNSVFIQGPNAGMRGIIIKEEANTLSIRQTDEVPNEIMRRMVVRIGVKHLKKLIQNGCSSIEVIQLRTNQLSIYSSGSGNIYLSGRVNLKKIVSKDSGSINVFGAYTPELKIVSSGSGAVNVSGNVGIQSIKHTGTGDINIIGANSDGLDINTQGAGKISIEGTVNLRQLIAKDNTCVYISSVNSECVDANLYGNARVGIAGVTQALYVNTYNNTLFWGQSLCAQNAYVNANDQSHINVTASKKVFASAKQSASIYFFGPSALLTQFTQNSGVIISMRSRNWCNYSSEYRAYSYTLMHKGETFIGSTPRPASMPSKHRHPTGRSKRAMNYIK